MAPVILGFGREGQVDCRVCVTGQHRQMLDQVMGDFGIKPHRDLNLMAPNQSLAGLTARCVEEVDRLLAEEAPDLVLVQGDTTTVFCATLASFYRGIPVGHVEAGLRTGNLHAPWPEEANRVLTSRLASLHFAPTEESAENLIREGICRERIEVTGNTVIDALFLALAKVRAAPPVIPGLPENLLPSATSGATTRRIVLITGHRRENIGDGFEAICAGIAELARRFPEVHFVYPVHLNPRVKEPVMRILGGGESNGNVHLIPPLSYLQFICLLDGCCLALTDSGGVQEEAPSLGKPVLVMRDTTERPEAVKAGTVKLVGTKTELIVGETAKLLEDAAAYAVMSRAHNPYGDGHAAERIIRRCLDFLGLNIRMDSVEKEKAFSDIHNAHA